MHTEGKIQQKIVMWFRNNYCTTKNDPQNIIFSVPNERKNAVENMKMKNTGMLSGVSDLIVVLNGVVLFVEVKTPEGHQSDRQLLFEKKVRKLNHTYEVVRSLEDFQVLVGYYLK